MDDADVKRAKIPTRYRCSACHRPLAHHTTADMVECLAELPRDVHGNAVRYERRD